ncbi:MAG: sporulation protein YabP [Clostridia bacterium]|nr:sporulation protein YabP [Clostridia bacterium]
MENEKKHSITIENREKMTITAVEDVESFDEEKIIVYTTMGKLTIYGYDFRINKLNVDDGQLTIEGQIDDIQYSDTNTNVRKGGFFSRMFQ